MIPNCLKHYQPVCNLPFLSKVLECIILKQFLQHLQSHSFLEPFQSSYRKCHSTETALIYFRLQTVAVFLLCHCLTCRQPLTQMTMKSKIQGYVAFRAVLARPAIGLFPTLVAVPSLCLLVRISPICSAMWSAAWFCSGTSSIYSVCTRFKYVVCQSGISYYFFADDSQLHNQVFLLTFQFLLFERLY